MRPDPTPPSAASRRTRTSHAPAAVLLAAALLACGDDPTSPREPIDATDAELAATRDAASDAANRIVTQLDATAGSATLRARLTELSTRIASRDPGVVADALARVRDALDAADRTGPADQAPDRAAVRLTVEAVQRLLDR